MALSIPPAKQMFSDAESPRELVQRREELVQEMTKATIAGLTGETTWGPKDSNFLESPISSVIRDPSRYGAAEKAYGEFEMAKSAEPAMKAWERMSKEWTLTNPVSTGLKCGAAA